MTNYFEYLRELLIRFFTDLGRFFDKAFASPWADVPGNFTYYNSLLEHYSNPPDFWFWFFWVLFLLLFLGLIGGIGFGLYLVIRKYVKFYKKELEKDEYGIPVL